MGKIINKITDLFLGGEDEFEEYEEETVEKKRFAAEPEAPAKQPLIGIKKNQNSGNNSRVVNIHAVEGELRCDIDSRLGERHLLPIDLS